ncbi:pentatricopeptide repeat (PPR) superfamily protein [Wolffia australiana]
MAARLAAINKGIYASIVVRLRSIGTSSSADLPPRTNAASERFILEQISDLLSVDLGANSIESSQKTLNVVASEEKPSRSCVLDGLLSPEERLRGVFIQKLVGKAAVEAALSSAGVSLTAEIIAGVLDNGNLGGAAMVSFFDWAIKDPQIPDNLDTYHIVLKALGRRKFFVHMEEILRRMTEKGVHPDSKTVSVITDCYARARHVSKAVKFFDRLSDLGGEKNGDSFTAVIRSLCRRSHVRVAESFLRRNKGNLPPIKTAFDEILAGWAKLGRVKNMKTTWKEMIESGISPDSTTYSHLIEGLGRARMIKRAVRVFNQMEEKGCSPDTATYNSIIFNFTSAGKLDRGSFFYREMIAKNKSPNSYTYQILISAFIRARRVADALEMFDEMMGRGICPTTGMITSFVHPLCRFGPPHAAMLIYKKSKKEGCVVSLKAYKFLLMRLSRFGKCGMILQVWNEMQESGYSSDAEVYEFIVEGLCNNGQLDTAVLVVEESIKNGCCVGRIVYSKLNNRLLEMDKVETAYRLLLKVKKARALLNSQKYWRSRGWHF